MGSKFQMPLNLKLLFLFLMILFFFYLLLNASSQFRQGNITSSGTEDGGASANSCSKIPPSLADAVVHYATSKITPQQTIDEISVTAEVLRQRSPCNFLVFGLGHDSLMWSALNHGGRTVFLEEDEKWIETVRRSLPATVEVQLVVYDTQVSEAGQLLELRRQRLCTAVGDPRLSKCPRLALRELPAVVYEVEWDVIMVDAPTGYHARAPGRMSAIYTAGMAARWREKGETDVMVHDVDRSVEDEFSKAFLCQGYMKRQAGRLRHFTIPSQWPNDGVDVPFCP
ncbi:glucuronoxylan 4-O-methyltransferase 2-like [Zingiber officinale]|uniref:glucuronoxylan 4-O-methyltransferase 2-like n=1 Tax=Zingiber officinale TaxID=94328 RepID=UPI001C4A9E83|nr:glucuronoxylan 4-O-methyltransferase 2-like [Zingiber officinale]